MIVLGITGPTGAGKTTALEVLAEMGFEIVDCDALYYQLLRTDESLRRALEEAFGPVFLPDGSLDRRAVAKRVFGDPSELAKLNSIVFPAVSGAVEQKIRECSQKGLAIDAINLVESGMGKLGRDGCACHPSEAHHEPGWPHRGAGPRQNRRPEERGLVPGTLHLPPGKSGRELGRLPEADAFLFPKSIGAITEGEHENGSKRVEEDPSHRKEERL